VATDTDIVRTQREGGGGGGEEAGRRDDRDKASVAGRMKPNY